MRLQRRGGRKFDHDPEGLAGAGAEAEPRRNAGQSTRARAPMADRERLHEVDHRPCGAGRRHGCLRLPAPAAHLPRAGHCGSRSWTGNSQGGSGLLRCWATGRWRGRSSGRTGAPAIKTTRQGSRSTAVISCGRSRTTAHSVSRARVVLKLKQTAGEQYSGPARPICAPKKTWWRVPWDRRDVGQRRRIAAYVWRVRSTDRSGRNAAKCSV
jgi:hypothetical protein